VLIVPKTGAVAASCQINVLEPEEAEATSMVPDIAFPEVTVKVTAATALLPKIILDPVPVMLHVPLFADVLTLSLISNVVLLSVNIVATVACALCVPPTTSVYQFK
jgi:hypothetical protein